MKKTVYQKTPRGWIIATEYYDWSNQIPAEDEHERISGMVTCPGCGKRGKRALIRLEHACPGTLTPEPVTVYKVQWRIAQRRLLEDKISQYVQTAGHPVSFSE